MNENKLVFRIERHEVADFIRTRDLPRGTKLLVSGRPEIGQTHEIYIGRNKRGNYQTLVTSIGGVDRANSFPLINYSQDNGRGKWGPCMRNINLNYGNLPEAVS